MQESNDSFNRVKLFTYALDSLLAVDYERSYSIHDQKSATHCVHCNVSIFLSRNTNTMKGNPRSGLDFECSPFEGDIVPYVYRC